MNTFQARGLGFVERGTQPNAPLPPLIEGLYIRFRHPIQAVKPAPLFVVYPIHRQILIVRMIHVERQEGRPQFLAVALLLHAVHLLALGDRLRPVLDTGEGFGTIQFLPQRRRVRNKQHIAIHKQHPPADTGAPTNFGHQESCVAELRAEGPSVPFVVGLPRFVGDPPPTEQRLIPKLLVLQEMNPHGLRGEAFDGMGQDVRGLAFAVVVADKDVLHVAILPHSVAFSQHLYLGIGPASRSASA